MTEPISQKFAEKQAQIARERPQVGFAFRGDPPGKLSIGEHTEEVSCACGAIYVQQVHTFEGGRVHRHPWFCPDCIAKQGAESSRLRDAMQGATEEGKRRKRLESLSVPTLYEPVTLENFAFHGSPAERTVQGRILQIARRYLGAWPQVETLLVFRGDPGTGKGHIAWAIAKEIVRQFGGTARVVKLAQLVRELRATWRDGSPRTEEQVLADYRRLDLLVIDEVSRHAFYGQQIHQHLYDVIDDRIEQCAPTILTSNETAEGLEEILRPALWNRLEGAGGIVNFGTASWRSRRGPDAA